ncbi:type IV pilus twitching motility protein PilT [Candidatus Gracilibacteria bacterium]|nr:type IV pilus twitching motility protein PilT [Candidatus Gracilibacteria bacterium]
MKYIELLNAILSYASKENYPDIHINSGQIPKIRDKSGEIEILKSINIDNNDIKIPVISFDGVKELIIGMAGEKGFKKFEEEMEFDTSYSYDGSDRYRVNCYMDTDGYSIAMRRIPNEIPSLEELGLGEEIKKMCNKNKGLILVTGPTGSGKSTNMAAMLDYINKNQKKHIITIEDPVEFAIKSDQSLVNQREIGNHTKGYANAIRASLREDPDVIMIGEMRDPETIKAAITLAETGHLVISTLHTNDSVQTVDRIVDVFPGTQQKQIRMQLAMSLVGILSQRLVTRSDKEGRIAAREILISNDAVRNLIIQGKTHQLYSVLEIGQKEGMILMDKYLMALYTKNIISKDSLISYVRNKEGIEMMIY